MGLWFLTAAKMQRCRIFEIVPKRAPQGWNLDKRAGTFWEVGGVAFEPECERDVEKG